MRRTHRGYTLVELFLTIGVLVMVLGLAVNLADRLRRTSLDHRARQQLQQLSAAVARFQAAHASQLPAAMPLLDPAEPLPHEPATIDPATLTARAARNAADVRLALGWTPATRPTEDPFTDPWGTPIVFMPSQTAIGMAPGDRPFFVSAGPDRQFITRADNLYSYDYAEDAPSTAPAEPDSVPARGGHRE